MGTVTDTANMTDRLLSDYKDPKFVNRTFLADFHKNGAKELS